MLDFFLPIASKVAIMEIMEIRQAGRKMRVTSVELRQNRGIARGQSGDRRIARGSQARAVRPGPSWLLRLLPDAADHPISSVGVTRDAAGGLPNEVRTEDETRGLHHLRRRYVRCLLLPHVAT